MSYFIWSRYFFALLMLFKDVYRPIFGKAGKVVSLLSVFMMNCRPARVPYKNSPIFGSLAEWHEDR